LKDNFKARLIDIDPSMWMKYPTVSIPKPELRKRQWVMAALSDHSAWVRRQGFKLPVYYIGNKRMESSAPYINELQLVQMFTQNFGVLSCGYKSAGSGWWRTRYLNAAWAETILYCDQTDAVHMGKCYQGLPNDFEDISSEREYEIIAEAQSEWLANNLGDKEIVCQKIERLIAK
jgi:hypothetical protein